MVEIFDIYDSLIDKLFIPWVNFCKCSNTMFYNFKIKIVGMCKKGIEIDVQRKLTRNGMYLIGSFYWSGRLQDLWSRRQLVSGSSRSLFRASPPLPWIFICVALYATHMATFLDAHWTPAVDSRYHITTEIFLKLRWTSSPTANREGT